MRVDSHVHTKNFSIDSILDIEKLVQDKSVEDIITLTEHQEFEDFLFEERKIKNNDFIFGFDKDEYFRKYEKYRQENNLLLGVELGLNIKNEHLVNEAYDERFDYILGSVHGLDNHDFYQHRQIYQEDKISLYNRYFDYYMEALRNFKYVNAVAHFDYISRYPFEEYQNPLVTFSEFKEKLSEFFKVLKELNVVLEINTKSDIYQKDYKEILKLYKSLGNDYVVIGSDSHDNERLFDKFDYAHVLIKEVGLKQVYFKKQKMVIIDES